MPGETSFIFPHAKLQPSPKSVKTPSRLNEHKSLKQSLTVLRNFEIVAARASVTVLEERTWTIRCSRMFHTWEKAQKMQFPFSRRNTFRSIRQESTTLETWNIAGTMECDAAESCLDVAVVTIFDSFFQHVGSQGIGLVFLKSWQFCFLKRKVEKKKSQTHQTDRLFLSLE